MNENLLEIRFSGEGIVPGNIRARELAEILQSVEDMLASTAIVEYPHLNKDDIVIGLVEIERGSVRYLFEPQLPDVVFPAYEIISNAIVDNKFDELQFAAIDSLRRIATFTRRHQVDAEFIIRNGGKRVLATITPKTEIEPIPLTIGETAIFGRVMRVGGKTPKVMIETPDGQSLFCDIDEKLAIELAPRLYSWVGLEGIARWNTKDYKIESFRIEQITDYEGGNILKTLKDLSILAGRYFDQIDDDVQKYVANIRRSEGGI